jgi:hypothetical protein
MNTTYSPVFRARMVKRLLRPSGPTPYQLSKEVGPLSDAVSLAESR